MFLFIIVGALLIGSALCKAVQDAVAHHNSLAYRGSWWDNNVSWKWKYKCWTIRLPLNDTVAADPRVERFPGSTTVFVWLTDAWHFFGMLNMSCWQTALCLLLPFTWYYQLLAFVLVKIGYGGVFELLYRRLNKAA